MRQEQQLTYRVATAADHVIVVAMLAELVDELGPHDAADRIKERLDADIRLAWQVQHIRIFLAEADGVAVGLSRGDVLHEDPIFRLRADHRCGYVDQMYVRAAYRDRGVGAELLARCEAWFRSQDIHHCVLHAAPRAVRFYARTGYQPNREMFKRI
jgi:GNAT superfamily N-acetyltransferase